MDNVMFSPLVDTLLLLVVHVPKIDAYASKTYSVGSYERKAFEKLKAAVPEMDTLAHRLVEADNGGVKLRADEGQRLRNVVATINNALAVMQEAGIDVEFTNLPPGFAGSS
jgi:hypothetical protein